MGRRENRHIFPWSTHQAIEFVILMHPDRGKPFHDGMPWVANRYLKRKANPMPSRRTRSRIRNHFAILYVPERTGIFVASSPTANSYHLVIGGPVWKCVICGMNN